MDNYVVSARKYRPMTFDSVVGQSSITTTLKNAIKSNHVAQAYLFCGPRGVGKTTCARILAKTLNCLNRTAEIEACGECESCKAFNENRSLNIHELDAASNNSVEDIRTLIDQVRIPPQIGKNSIYIIDEVHMLSAQAFNAFLKTLEEPPSHAVFILATTEKHKIIPTILSRCQIFDFNRIQVSDMVSFLMLIAQKENVTAEEEALNIVAQKADGGMRDALSIFDQLVSFCGNQISYQDVITNLNILDYEYYFRLVDSFLANNVAEGMLIFNEILNSGFEPHNFINGLSSHFRDLLVCKNPDTLNLLEVGASIREKYKSQSASCEQDFLFDALQITNECDVQYKTSRNHRLHVELALIKLANVTLKKKLDTSSSELILGNETINNQPVNAKKKSTPSPPPEEKKAKPLPQYKSSFSIRDALNTKADIAEEAKPESIQQTDLQNTTSFTPEQLTEKWKIYAEKLKEERPRLYHAMKNQQPTLNNASEVIFELRNNSQKEEFDLECKIQIQNFLKKELNNESIHITSTVTEIEEENAVPYTAIEKFSHLSNKYPALQKLKQEFNLDFD